MKFKSDKPAPKRSWQRIAGILLVVVLVLAGLGWAGAEQWYRQNLRSVSPIATEILFTVHPGTPTLDIANQLEEAGVIRNATAFIWYLGRLDGEPVLQAGSYRLNTTLDVSEVADRLINGLVDTSLVTIAPGLRLDQIEVQLINAGFVETEVKQALAKDYDHALLENKPADASLEGYIFPETLQVTADSTVESIIIRSFDIFYEQLDPALLEGLQDKGLTLHEAITLASIIQEEVSGYEDQRKVAQVFLRRLDEGMPLGADPTFRYAAAIQGVEATPDLESPYNTRIHAGLPPGPIANFAISAIRAIADPADTDFLYFVSGDDGTTYFSRTLQEHETNVDRYCVELCQL